MNPGALLGAIPENVLLSARAIVSAGFANDVDAVSQAAWRSNRANPALSFPRPFRFQPEPLLPPYAAPSSRLSLL